MAAEPVLGGVLPQRPVGPVPGVHRAGFYCSEYEDDEAGEAMDGIEEQMNVVELRYLMKYCGNNPRKGILTGKIAEAEK